MCLSLSNNFCQVHCGKLKNIKQFKKLFSAAFAEVKFYFFLFLTSQWLYCVIALTTALTGDNMLTSYSNSARAPSDLVLSYEAEMLFIPKKTEGVLEKRM